MVHTVGMENDSLRVFGFIRGFNPNLGRGYSLFFLKNSKKVKAVALVFYSIQ